MTFNDNKNIGFEIFSDAELLGEDWDKIAGDNIFLKKSSLLQLQRTNPCDQRYYINEEEKTIFISYRLRLNMFTLKRGLDIRLPVTIIGIPCSVSYKGYSYIKNRDSEYRTSNPLSRSPMENSANSSKVSGSSNFHKLRILEEGIESLKGIKLVLNADDDLSFAKGYTLPQYILDIRWKSFEDYLASMRSHYRYRVKKALLSGTAIKAQILKIDREKMNEDQMHYKKADTRGIVEHGMYDKKEPEESSNCSFPIDMYRLYEEVYENSKDKLEKLDIEFFRTFPSTIITFYIENGEDRTPAGFIQIKDNNLKKNNESHDKLGTKDHCNKQNKGDDSDYAPSSDNDELIFMFAGLNHSLNLKYDIYLNMLLYMIRYAIENGYKSIDLGQTTMDTKMKLGAMPRPKYMYLTSDNPLFRRVMPLAARVLSYNERQKDMHVFKDRKVTS